MCQISYVSSDFLKLGLVPIQNNINTSSNPKQY